MKKILLSFFIFSVAVFAQTGINNQPAAKILSLENPVKTFKQVQTSRDFSSYESVSSKKSAGLAILLSALLPGMGELYAGDYSSGKYFTIAEGSLWGVYYGLNTFSNWQKERYKAYAAAAAGVNLQGKDATYFANIADYMNIDQYNNEKALEQNFNQMYNTSQAYWYWQSNTDRKTYRNMWVNGEQSHNSLRFVVGALILNRLVSAINAARLVAAYNKRQSENLSWNVSVGMNNYQTLPTSLTFNFQTEF